MKAIKAAFVTIVPSPYQRDLFRALAQRPEVALSVFYLEAAVPDSPWPEKPLAPFEQILPGRALTLGLVRSQINWPLPRLREFDVVVVSGLTALTAQWLMRFGLRGKRWLFWGEKLRGRNGASFGGKLHARIAAPLNDATGIVAIGSRAEADYRRRFPRPRHFNIPYYCDVSGFLAAPSRRNRSPNEKASENDVVFFFCGQMIARKGVDVLFAAFDELVKNERACGARLLLVGREAELPQMLRTLSTETRARIEYAGFQAPEELPRFFAKADVFVLPSRYDGWGVVVNQALGAGLPILVSDAVGAGCDLVEENVNGAIFETGNAASLLEKMRRFLAEPELLARWGASSRCKAAEWTPECGAERWIKVLQAVAPVQS
jgi:poly(glycerol-phosphate) alpha-glucosyltransferase